MVLARARPCGWTGCPEERARVLGSTRHQMLPWSSLQARQAGFCLYLSTLRFLKGGECADEREAGVQVSEELFCRELRSSQSRLYQPLEEGWSWYSRGPSGFRGPALLGSRLLTGPLFSGSVRSTSHRSVFLWSFVVLLLHGGISPKKSLIVKTAAAAAASSR